MSEILKAEYQFNVKLATLSPKDRKAVEKRIKSRLGIKSQAFRKRLCGEVLDVWGNELRIWAQELNCTIEALYKN